MIFDDGAHVLQLLEHRLRRHIADVAFTKGLKTRTRATGLQRLRTAVAVDVLIVREPAREYARRVVHAVDDRVVSLCQQLADSRNLAARQAGEYGNPRHVGRASPDPEVLGSDFDVNGFTEVDDFPPRDAGA